MSDSAGQSRAWDGGPPRAGLEYSAEPPSAPQWQRGAHPPSPDFPSGTPGSYAAADRDHRYQYNVSATSDNRNNNRTASFNSKYENKSQRFENDKKTYNHDKYPRDRSRSKSRNRGGYSRHSSTNRKFERRPRDSSEKKKRGYRRSRSSSGGGRRSCSSSSSSRAYSSASSSLTDSYSPKRRRTKSRSNSKEASYKHSSNYKKKSNCSKPKSIENDKSKFDGASTENISSKKYASRQYDKNKHSKSRSRSGSRDRHSRKYSTKPRSSSRERHFSKNYDFNKKNSNNPPSRFDKTRNSHPKRRSSNSDSKDDASNKFNDAMLTDNSDDNFDSFNFDDISTFSQSKATSQPKSKKITQIPTVTPFKNDGSFLEMFKKMQESRTPAESSSTSSVPTAVHSTELKKPMLPFIGKRRGGRLLKTGMVKKVKTIEEHTVTETPKDAWSLYLQEVKKYRDSSCEEEGKTRPLVK